MDGKRESGHDLVREHPLRKQEFHETTILVPWDLVLADLFDQIQVGDFHVSAQTDRNDTYFDTADCDLIRFGVILRLRSKTGRLLWNFQFFSNEGGKYSLVHDLEYSAHSSDLPTPLIDLLYAFHRGRPLLQIGQVRTTQTSHIWRNAKGRLEEEIIDRSVTSDSVRWEAKGFREITLRSRAGARARHRWHKALEAAAISRGGSPAVFAPEIIRVLGSRCAWPFAILEAPPDSGSRAEAILQAAIARSILRILRFDLGMRLNSDPEMVHQFRVTLRRIRSDLRSFSPLCEPPESFKLRSELSWLGGEVGKVRDCDVLVGHLHELARGSAHEERSGVARVQSALNDLCVSNRARLLENLDTGRYVALVERLVDISSGAVPFARSASAVLDKTLTRSSEDLIRKVVRKRWRKFARAARKLDAGSSDLEIHHVRILAKRCRYAAEVVPAPLGRRARKFSRQLAEVQDLLGRYHDCVFQESWLREIAEGLPEARIAIGGLILLMRQERSEIRAQWPLLLERTAAPKLRRWLKTGFDTSES